MESYYSYRFSDSWETEKYQIVQNYILPRLNKRSFFVNPCSSLTAATFLVCIFLLHQFDET